MRRLRIHGDNIIECERTLLMIVDAFAAQYTILKSELYLPIYKVDIAPAVSLQIELLSGHGRWGVDINNLLMNSGGILREGADSYLTEVSNGVERILLAIEYCSALPAGNNAWQRNGRAYSCVLAGVPYLYYAEIGGVELNEDRTVKAPRYPNPIVPYSYLSATKRMSSFCLPVYKPHPSITDDIFTKFKNVFGVQDGLAILKGIIMGLDISDIIDALADKSLKMAAVLADGRRVYDTLRGEEWADMAESSDPINWIKENKQSLLWSKRTAAKVNVSDSFRTLLKETVELGCLTIGAKDVPICLIPNDKILGFKKILNELYPDIELNIGDQEDLIVIWITGFKPQGDDSRPDRGLVPLARMVAGEEANMLSIVYGPAKSRTWNLAASSLDQLAEDNGLWQSIINISNGLLIDSATSGSVIYSNLSNSVSENIKPVEFPYVSPTVSFGEHDTDCAIHQIFAHKESMHIYESLCNLTISDQTEPPYRFKRSQLYRTKWSQCIGANGAS